MQKEIYKEREREREREKSLKRERERERERGGLVWIGFANITFQFRVAIQTV